VSGSRPLGVSLVAMHIETSGSMGPQTPIVGRSVERALLRNQLASIADGSGRLVILGGEAGIGKTTLSRDLIAHAAGRGYRTLVGHCYDLAAAAPYGIWRDLCDGYRRTADPAIDPAAPLGLDPGEVPQGPGQSGVFSRMLDFLRDLAASGPVLVVLEDVHWADPESLELLRHVASRLAGTPILLVLTYRMDELTRRNPFYRQFPALVRESEGNRIDLRRLDRAALAELVESRYALASEPAAAVVGYLAQHAEGNPFFAVELLRALEEQEGRGLLWDGAGWSVAGLDEVVVPDLVKQVIELRIARLGDAVREPLAVAAVIGQDVEVDLWAAAAGLDLDALMGIIEQAVDGALLAANVDGSHVHFVHALTREALYEGIMPVRRRLIHGRVAAALQAIRSHDPDPIAWHLRHAGDPSAPEWLIKAGERAQRTYAWLTAHDRFMAAATLLERGEGAAHTRARLLYRCGRLLRYSDAANGIESLRMAERLAELEGDRVLAADARYSRGLIQCFADQWSQGLAGQEEGISAMEALPVEEARIGWTTVNWMADALPEIDLPTANAMDPAANTLIAAGVNHRRGGLPWFLATAGYLDKAQAMATRFTELVEGIETGPLVRSATGHAWFSQGIAWASLGQPSEARAAFAQARDIYARLDHHAVIAFTLLTELMDVVIPYHGGNAAERHRLAADAERALHRAAGALPAGSLPQRAHLPALALDGRWDEALAIAGDATTHGNYVMRRLVTVTLAPIALHQGRAADAWRYVYELLPEGLATPFGGTVLTDALMLQEIAIELCLRDVELESAQDWLEMRRRWIEQSGARIGIASQALGAARIALASGAPAHALRLAHDANAMASDPPQPLVALEAMRLQGEASLKAGQRDLAADAYRQAMAMAERRAMPFEVARARLGLAAALDRSDRDEAISLAHAARATFDILNANPSLELADTLLASLEQPVASIASQGGLTARELEVLRLAATGLTDAEIGVRLYISARTVSQHLRSIYAKLGIRSRAAATRYAMEHGLA